MEHFAGVRPTVKDRRPLVGTHAEYSAIHILNGLGTRGVMLGPSMAKANARKMIFFDSAIDIKDLSQKSEMVLFLKFGS
jgi:glycine/D-amino acid oxidase-like deaminating enzyme